MEEVPDFFTLYRATHQQPPGRTTKQRGRRLHIYWSGPQGKKPPGAEAPPAPCCIFQPQVPAKGNKARSDGGCPTELSRLQLSSWIQQSRTFCKVPFTPKGSSDSNQLLFPHSLFLKMTTNKNTDPLPKQNLTMVSLKWNNGESTCFERSFRSESQMPKNGIVAGQGGGVD